MGLMWGFYALSWAFFVKYMFRLGEIKAVVSLKRLPFSSWPSIFPFDEQAYDFLGICVATSR